jgi:hypothetical protein
LRFDAAHHGLAPPVLNHAFRNLGTGSVEAKEGTCGDISVELSAVGYQCSAEFVEHLHWQSAGIVSSLEH